MFKDEAVTAISLWSEPNHNDKFTPEDEADYVKRWEADQEFCTKLMNEAMREM